MSFAFRRLARSPLRRCYSASAAALGGGGGVRVPLYRDGTLIPSTATADVPVHNPATQQVIARTPLCSVGEMEAAVASAAGAFPEWSSTSISNRARVMARLAALIRDETDSLAALITAGAPPYPTLPHPTPPYPTLPRPTPPYPTLPLATPPYPTLPPPTPPYPSLPHPRAWQDVRRRQG